MQWFKNKKIGVWLHFDAIPHTKWDEQKNKTNFKDALEGEEWRERERAREKRGKKLDFVKLGICIVCQ